MVLDELLQLRDQLLRTTRREIRLDPILDRLSPKLLECGDGTLGERVVREVDQRRSPPKGQGG